VLEVAGLCVAFGRHEALHEVDLTVARGETVTILGANGAGKSTLLGAIAGVIRPARGEHLRFDGADIGALPPHAIVEAGIALVPEGHGIFADLTVRENLALGAFARRARANETRNRERVLALFPRLAERLDQPARTMSGGEQKMVAVARALMADPRLLLLDEPSLGLAPRHCAELFAALAQLRDAAPSILLVEQNAHRSLALADRGYVLAAGRIVAEGSADALREDPAVARAYLGAAAEKSPLP
jgi:branched-chain amino acid transport system ATP-binding protein